MNAKILKTLLAFDAANGVFTWKPRLGVARNDKAGLTAGSKRKDGYIQISIHRKQYLVHRLAWLYTYGEWPICALDHIDRNRSNNCVTNLRLATPLQNAQNTKRYRNNTSGCKGVYLHAYGKYEAYITKNKTRIYLGVYDSLAKAANARLQAQKEMFSHAGVL